MNSAQASDRFLTCIWCLWIMIIISPISSNIRATSADHWVSFSRKATWQISSHWWIIGCLYIGSVYAFICSSSGQIVLGCFVLHWMGSCSMWVSGSLCSLNELKLTQHGLSQLPVKQSECKVAQPLTLSGKLSKKGVNYYPFSYKPNIILLYSTHKYNMDYTIIILYPNPLSY